MTAELSPAALTRALSDMERELAGGEETTNVAQRLVVTACGRVPGAQHAGITSLRAGKFSTLAATDPLVERTDAIQYRLSSGPCVDALVDDLPFRSADLRTDTRWPEFGAEAARTTGVISMLSFRLSIDNEVDALAALNFYSTEVAAFDDASQAIGLLVTTQGALAITRARAQEKVENLLIALKTSREIGMAIGVLMQSLKIDREEAFNLLRIVSQRTHRKLAAIAVEVADTGVLPASTERRSFRGHPA